MQALWLLTVKNLKLLLRSKASALIIIFAPLLIILLLGLSYNTSSRYGLNIGIHASSFSDDVNSFIDLLKEDEFTITKYEESIDHCLGDMKRSAIHACLILPENLQVEGNGQREVVFYVDPSRIQLVSVIQNAVDAKFNLKSREISQNLAQDLISRLTDSKQKIQERKTELEDVKGKSSAASSNSATVQGRLSGIDITDPATKYDSSVIQMYTQNVNNAKSSVESALSSLQQINATAGEKATVENFLTAAQGSLANGTTNEPALNSLFLTIQTDLSAAITAISGSKTDVAAVTSSLQEVNAKLDSVVSGLEEIRANLEAQKVTEAGTIISPLITRVERVSPEGTYLSYLFPALLVLVVMFSSMLLGTTLVIIEKNSPAFLRNFFLPIRTTTFMLSIYVTNLILIIIELVIILGISLFFLGESASALPSVALILFLTASIFTFLGMGIGYLFTSEETGVLASISLSSILLLLSGTILPLEGISSSVRGFLFFNPFVIAEELIREVFIFSTPLEVLTGELLFLFSYALILCIIISIAESVLHRHFLSRYLRKQHLAHHQKQRGGEKVQV
ncbi:ABC transporter permease [Candidatus Woesearchaeota archaeon]|nr:ABC transporter permease [Candidatus Woesearchaeota archaeon]